MAQSLGDAVIEVGADLDDLDRDLLRGTRRAARNAEREGDAIGFSLSRGIGRGASRNDDAIGTFGQLEFSLAKVAGAGTGLISAIVPLPALLGGIVAGAVAVGGAVGQAAGSALSAAGVLGSVGLAAATTAVASRGLTDAFDAQSKAQQELAETGDVSESTQQALDAALKNLAPSARAVVREVSALGPAWSSMQRSVQGTLFRGVAGDLRSLSDAVLPSLTSNLTRMAETLNGAVSGFTRFITAGRGAEQIDSILGGLNATFEALLPGIGALGRGILSLFTGSTGPAVEMARAISVAASGFADWAEAVTSSGQLTLFLRDANATMGTLLGITGNLGSILVSVFGAGVETGDNLLRTFEQATGQLAAFLQTAGAQSGLAQFFGLVQQSGLAIRQLGSVAVPIFQGIFAVIGTLIPHINNLRAVLLPVAQALGTAIGGALQALAPVIGFVVGLVVQLLKWIQPLAITLVNVLGPGIERIASLFMQHLAPAISGLLPVLQPVVAFFVGVFGQQIANAVNFVVSVIGGLFKILGGLLTFLTGVFTGDWSKAWKGLVQVFDGVVDILGAAVKFLWKMITNAFNAGTSLVTSEVRAWFQGIIQGFVDWNIRIVQNVKGLWDRVTNNFRVGTQAVIQTVARNLGSIVGTIARIGIDIVRSVTSTWERFANAVRTGVSRVVSFVASLPGQVMRAISGLGSLLVSAGSDLIQGFINGVQSRVGAAVSAVTGVASSVAGAFRSVLGISSPSKLFAQYGRFTAQGFEEGFTEEAARGRFAFREVGQKALQSLTNGFSRGGDAARADVKSVLDRISEMTSTLLEQNQKAMERQIEKIANSGLSSSAQRTAVATVRAVFGASNDSLREASRALAGNIRSRSADLTVAWREFDRSADRLKNAQDRLKAMRQEMSQFRDQIASNITGQLDLGSLVSTDADTPKPTFGAVSGVVNAMLAKAQKFGSIAKKLVKAGLPPAFIQQIAGLGLDGAIQVGEAILSGSKQNIRSLAADFTAFTAHAKGIGTTLAQDMFGAGVAAQEGIVKGLTKDTAKLKRAAQILAARLARYVKQALGIRSPSRVFAAIGEFLPPGMAQGITRNEKVAIDAAGRMAASVERAAALTPLGARTVPQQRLSPLTANQNRPGLTGNITSQQPSAAAAAPSVEVTQIFTGPTTSGGRLREINWNVRYATQSRSETIGGVAR